MRGWPTRVVAEDVSKTLPFLVSVSNRLTSGNEIVEQWLIAAEEVVVQHLLPVVAVLHQLILKEIDESALVSVPKLASDTTAPNIPNKHTLSSLRSPASRASQSRPVR